MQALFNLLCVCVPVYIVSCDDDGNDTNHGCYIFSGISVHAGPARRVTVKQRT